MPKILLFVLIGMVIAQVDTSQYDLLIARSFLALHMINDGSNASTA